MYRYTYTGVRGFRCATENVPNRQPTACTTSSPLGVWFLSRQLPKTGISPIRYVLPNQQAIDCHPSYPPFTTSAVYNEYMSFTHYSETPCMWHVFHLFFADEHSILIPKTVRSLWQRVEHFGCVKSSMVKWDNYGRRNALHCSVDTLVQIKSKCYMYMYVSTLVRANFQIWW